MIQEKVIFSVLKMIWFGCYVTFSWAINSQVFLSFHETFFVFVIFSMFWIVYYYEMLVKRGKDIFEKNQVI